MTELQLYKFIQENDVEWHHDKWETAEGKDDVLIFVHYADLKEFIEMLGGYLDESALPAMLKGTHAAIQVREICEYFGIEMENVFPPDSE